MQLDTQCVLWMKQVMCCEPSPGHLVTWLRRSLTGLAAPTVN